MYAALAEKDAAGVAAALQARIDRWHLAGLDGPRGQSAAQLRERLAGTAASATLSATVEQALASVLEQARRGDRVLVFGSFHTVAEALPLLQQAAR